MKKLIILGSIIALLIPLIIVGVMMYQDAQERAIPAQCKTPGYGMDSKDVFLYERNHLQVLDLCLPFEKDPQKVIAGHKYAEGRIGWCVVEEAQKCFNFESMWGPIVEPLAKDFKCLAKKADCKAGVFEEISNFEAQSYFIRSHSPKEELLMVDQKPSQFWIDRTLKENLLPLK